MAGVVCVTIARLTEPKQHVVYFLLVKNGLGNKMVISWLFTYDSKQFDLFKLLNLINTDLLLFVLFPDMYDIFSKS